MEKNEVGKETINNLTNRMLRVCKTVPKAKGRYFEEYKI